jgi:hypothetical protein
MAKIIELHPAVRSPVNPSLFDAAGPPIPISDEDPVLHATGRLVHAFGDLVAALEASHRRIRMLIDTVPDPEAKARLGRDLATLSAALKDARAKAAAVGLLEERR